MAVDPKEIRRALMPGLHLAFNGNVAIGSIPKAFRHLRFVAEAAGLREVRDLFTIPTRIDVDGEVYETRLVSAGREYPQGWGARPRWCGGRTSAGA